MKIVNLDGCSTNPGDLSWDAFNKYGDFTVYERTAPEQIVERAKDADVIIINKSIINNEILDELPNLKYVGLQSTGYNVIDTVEARKRGITVSNIPAYSTNEVAQMVFAYILHITSKVAMHDEAVHNGEWCSCPDFCFWKAPLEEMNGKTIGIIGYGSIGRRVARIAGAFGMRILVNTPHPADDEGIEFVTLETLLKQSDFVTCHCPLNSDTEKLINADRLNLMKKTTVLINTSRGPVVDEPALAEALNSGRIRAACVDVLSVEPPSEDNPLLHAKNCVITPHISWAATETRARLLTILEANLKAFIDGHPQNVVN
ncbi:MAG: D-2-hydroxyacid dehydrogenase [Eubacterium sp.]|nr:D-2-hydroxyacid dehydrogenase [Eubacterium sp.]MBR0412184.1 D-2-hydroxyacid dehydrogenase [Eubacterium sp.]